VAPRSETVYVAAATMPVGGPAGSRFGRPRRRLAAAPEPLSRADAQPTEKQESRAAGGGEAEGRRRTSSDPLLFPFEDYFFMDLAGARRRFVRHRNAPGAAPGELRRLLGLLESIETQDGRARRSCIATVTDPGFLGTTRG